MVDGFKLLRTTLPLLLSFYAAGPTNTDPQLGATDSGQSAADAFKSYTGSDVAFIPADLIGKPLAHNDLASILSYPKEHFVVLTLTGGQLKKAFERSVLLYPSANAGFLQVAGVEISFSKAASPNSRVTEVKVNGSKLEDGHKYEVAMPASLQKGQLGYSDLWEDAKVFHKYPDVTMQEILKGKHSAASSSRWTVQP
jgi:hypothetical protein